MMKWLSLSTSLLLIFCIVALHTVPFLYAAHTISATPPNSAGNTAAVTSSAGDNNGLETNPINAVLNGSGNFNDTVYAVSTNSGTAASSACSLPNTSSDQHDFFNFGVYGGDSGLTSDAQINGLTATVDARYDSASGTNTVCAFLSWNNGTNWTTGKNTADINASDSGSTLGGAADLWGRGSWTATELTNANFRMRIMSLVANTARDLSVDYVRISVDADDRPRTVTQDSPVSNATGLSLTPNFLMTASDPDASNIAYRVQIYSNSSCTTLVQTHEQAVTSTGWSGTNTSCTAAPNSCYTSGTQGNFTVQAGNALTATTDYWWIASAKDPDDVNAYGTSTCRKFTTGTGNSAPVASAVSVDSGAASVTLTEGTTKNVVCTGTVTDDDGFADIDSVTADFFRTSRGIGSALDDNDHYQLSGDANVIPSGGSGNSETYTATFPVQYFADATDADSPNSGDTWTCTLTPSDGEGAGTASSDTIEMNSLLALDVTSSISYGSLSPNTDTGATNQTVTVTNTGNRDMDPQISGGNMTSGGNTIVVGQQKYSGSTFTYSSGGTVLTTTPTTLNLTLPQRTSTAVTANTYWGIGVPNGTVSGSYSGTNTYTATTGI